MWHPRYDFSAFVEHAKDLTPRQILELLEEEDRKLSSELYGNVGSPAARDAGGVEYHARLKRLAFLFNFGSIPGGATPGDRMLYRDLVTALHARKLVNEKLVAAILGD